MLLDEAHKGDKEESKRQHIYSILSRNGFLFNFSATFTDQRDILTTAYDFNLARFVEAGYGKHILLLKQETRAFQDKEDYTGAEKQKLVLKDVQGIANRINLERMNTLFNNVVYMVENLRMKEAKQIFNRILTYYNMLSDEVKAEVNERLQSLRGMIENG